MKNSAESVIIHVEGVANFYLIGLVRSRQYMLQGRLQIAPYSHC